MGHGSGGRRKTQVRRQGCCALIALLSTLGGCKEENRYVAPPPPKVTVAAPIQQRITRYLEATGNTAAYNSVDLEARVQGYLEKISYADGARVEKGDILFTIEPLPYYAKLQQATAAVAGAQSQLRNSQFELDRQQTLRRQGVNTERDLDNAQANLDAARASFDQANANQQLAAITYSYTRVMAPFDGTVTAHLKSVGELVGTQPTKLATLVQLDPIYVTFTVSEQDVLRIRAEMTRRGLSHADLDKVPVEIGLQSEQGFPHAGYLNYAAPSVDASTGTLQVRGVFENKASALLPGYFVRVRVPVAQDVQAMLVPNTAIGADQGGRYVLVVGADDLVEQRHVTTGPLEGALRVIESGLRPDERVVVAGVQRAVPGQKVEPQVQAAAR